MLSALIERFPSSETLLEYLRTKAGGSLCVSDSSDKYSVIYYKKGHSNFEIPHVKLFRSIVWDKDANTPVSITPSKSAMGESIPVDLSNYTIETFHDGVLIGQFWDGTSWRIHTRTVLDANCRYYSHTKSFATMFKEAISAMHTKAVETAKEAKTAEPIPLYDRLDKTVSYSWILQHPENRIVTEVRSPRITLVGAFRKYDRVPRSDLLSLNEFLPKQHTFETPHAVKLALSSWESKYSCNFQGLVFLNKETGERSKIRTDTYNRARTFRGNTPRLDFLWLQAWRTNTLKEYEWFYPEEKSRIRSLLNQWKEVTTEVFNIYIAKYKERKDIILPVKYKGLMYALHKYYIEHLRPSGDKITFKNLIDWMNQRDIPQMLYLLNYERRTLPELPIESSSTVVDSTVLTVTPAAEAVDAAEAAPLS